jgi:uncharacterized membrane protein YbhN (UPF0104 family)
MNRLFDKPVAIKKRFSLILRMFLGIALLGITFYLVDWRSVINVITKSDPQWIITAGMVMLVTLGLKLVRWRTLLLGYGINLRWVILGRAFFSGQTANILLPVRGGEAVRLGIAASEDLNQLGILTASITVEKILDACVLLLLTVWVLSHQTSQAILAGGSPLWFNGLFFMALLALIPIWRVSRPLLIQIESKTVRVLVDTMDRIAQYLLWIISPRRFLLFFTMTVAIWALMLITNLCVMRAVALPFQFDAAVAVLVLIYVGLAPALMPGNLGPFIVFAGLGLMGYGLDPNLAFAFAVLLHLIVTIPPLLLSVGFNLVGQRR